ncbi:enhancer of mRNA-decapping 4-like [Haematococcus lacustris]|uniref:Enhancer of mRNA-decapping 4-like n=1 Tax=Haematococcus lacustris TaxID=44745 RepID=A0A699ZSV5_HAELA|nr:enhancer of mRNA-decapping 4-like [Haematococcus lacustris]
MPDQLRCGQYNDAFTTALNADTATLLWLLGHTSCEAVLGHQPCPLTREVLLSLVSHLTYDLATDTPLKLQWLHQLGCCLHASLAAPPGCG